MTEKGKDKETVPTSKEDEGGHAATRGEIEHEREEQAATVVQRAWRHHAMWKKQLNSDARWKDALTNTKKQVTLDAAQGNEKNDPKSRWRRGVFLAGRLQDGEAVMTEDDEPPTKQSLLHTKSLEVQHWLELVDLKHRYGSNLKWYHQKWREAETSDNFFRWLDRGEGKEVSLPECTREQLESERIIYLSAEQRLNYFVTIDSDGRLRWKRNGQYVDTTPGMWVDAGDGRGIVKADGSDEIHIRPRKESATSQSSSDEEKAAKHYQGAKKDSNLNTLQRVWKDRFTTKGLMERLLRKTVRKNTWLYVSDKNYNLFVGLKETGYFQHSSMTAGGLVTSAGLIEVKDGLVTSLSPLSGHYRTSMEHFKQFVHAMEERDMDTSKLHMTRGEAMLWGLEHWKGLQKSTKESTKQLKQAVHVIAHPNEARKEKQDATKKAEEGSARSKYEETQHFEATSTASSSLKPEDVKDKALREKIERMRKRKEEEDERWRSQSEWRWEAITGRGMKGLGEGKEKFKSAVELVLPSTSNGKASPVPSEEGSLQPGQIADPAITDATKEAIAPSATCTCANPGYASDSAAIASQSHPREQGSVVPKVDIVTEGVSTTTSNKRSPADDTPDGVKATAENSPPTT